MASRFFCFYAILVSLHENKQYINVFRLKDFDSNRNLAVRIFNHCKGWQRQPDVFKLAPHWQRMSNSMDVKLLAIHISVDYPNCISHRIYYRRACFHGYSSNSSKLYNPHFPAYSFLHNVCENTVSGMVMKPNNCTQS